MTKAERRAAVVKMTELLLQFDPNHRKQGIELAMGFTPRLKPYLQAVEKVRVGRARCVALELMCDHKALAHVLKYSPTLNRWFEALVWFGLTLGGDAIGAERGAPQLAASSAMLLPGPGEER